MAKATKNIKVKKEKETKIGYFPENEELKVFNKFKDRKDELLKSRGNIGGLNIDTMMSRFDHNYFNRDNADIPPAELDADQTPIAINNAFGKVQTVLGILIQNNPDWFLEEHSSKYTANK